MQKIVQVSSITNKYKLLLQNKNNLATESIV